MRGTLIKNAAIVSMDPAIGDLDGGDLLIDDEKIVAVGRHIEAGDATVIDGRGCIAIPGLVNAHIHTWEFALRGIVRLWCKEDRGNGGRSQRPHARRGRDRRGQCDALDRDCA